MPGADNTLFARRIQKIPAEADGARKALHDGRA